MEKIIKNFFSCCDNQTWDYFKEIFSDDIIYCRPGSDALFGVESLINFFKNERPVASGIHKIHKILKIADNEYAVLGWFDGRLKNNTSWQGGFFDYLVFSQGKICFRKTYLDNQAQDHIGDFLEK